jgi:hemerythrin superfamily protein
MDVLDVLVGDHQRVRGLIQRYQDAEEAHDTRRTSELAQGIIEELTLHMDAEEKVLYASVKDRSEEIGEDVDEGYQEHHVARVLMGEIGELEPGDATWVAKMTVLIESTEHHLDEEEDELFPSVRASSEAAWRDQLGAELDAAEVAGGATPLDEKLAGTTTELRTAAREQSIPGRSSMDHDELASAVDPHRI